MSGRPETPQQSARNKAIISEVQKLFERVDPSLRFVLVIAERDDQDDASAAWVAGGGNATARLTRVMLAMMLDRLAAGARVEEITHRPKS